MNIGIIGAGNMGAGLGKLWAKAGHQVVFSYSRDENKLRELATSAGVTAKAGTVQDAAAQDVILLAVWLPALTEVIQAAGSLDGKIVITCVSGLQPDFTGQTIGLATDLHLFSCRNDSAASTKRKSRRGIQQHLCGNHCFALKRIWC